MTLALVRHGRTEWNRRRRMQGRSDIALDECGRAQAEAIARRLAATATWSRIMSSPLARARETAAIIAATLERGASPVDLRPTDPNTRGRSTVGFDIDERLRERDYGFAEGMAVDEAWARWPAGDFPDSEPRSAVLARALSAVEQFGADGQPTIVVAHGTLIRLALTQLTGVEVPRVRNGEAILWDNDGTRRIAV